MSPDDILFAPILPGDIERKLRELVRKIMNKPADDRITTGVANQIVELFNEQGITNENEMVDAVNRIIKEMNGNQFDASNSSSSEIAESSTVSSTLYRHT